MRSIPLFSAVLTAAFLSATAYGQICVDARNLAGTPDGTPAKPFRTIQAAINVATTGQSVLVATGDYTEDLRVESDTVELYGGFAGGSTQQYATMTPGDFDTRDTVNTPTTITGTGDESVVTLLDAGFSVVDGIRITGGGGSTNDLPYASNGGGMYINGGTPIIRNNIIDTNDPTRPGDITTFGGAIYTENANATIEYNDINENTAERGAGIASFGGNVTIQYNTIRGNIGTGDHGGGLYIGCPLATITHNRIYENEIGRGLGYGWGAGMIIFNPGNHAECSFNEIFANYTPGLGAAIFVDEGATANLRNELIYRNEAPAGGVGGGAVYVDGGEINGIQMGSIVSIVNCTIADNPVQDAYVGGNALFVEGASTVTVRNSIFWGNGLEVWNDPTSSIAVTYSNIDEAVPGAGNINQDPLFADFLNADFHLQSTAGRWDPNANAGLGAFVMDTLNSPSIDAGNPSDDLPNEPAPNGGRINQGAYGNTPEASLSNANAPDTDLNDDDVVNAIDVQLVINGALGVGAPADVNNDGQTNAIDIQLVINAALGL